MRRIIILIVLLIIIGAGGAAGYWFFFYVEEPEIVDVIKPKPIIRDTRGYPEIRTRASFLDPGNPIKVDKYNDKTHISIEGNLIWYEMCKKIILPKEVIENKQTLMKRAVFRIDIPNADYANLVKNVEKFVIRNYIELSRGSEYNKYFCDDIEFKLPKDNIRYTEEEYQEFTHFYFNGKRRN